MGLQLCSALVDPGVAGTCALLPTPGVQILSFPCSFRQKNLQNNPNLELAHPPRENPGSATAVVGIASGARNGRVKFTSKQLHISSLKKKSLALFPRKANRTHAWITWVGALVFYEIPWRSREHGLLHMQICKYAILSLLDCLVHFWILNRLNVKRK